MRDRDLRDHFVAQELQSFEDIYCDPVVCVDVECFDYVAKADSCLKPEFFEVNCTILKHLVVLILQNYLTTMDYL